MRILLLICHFLADYTHLSTAWMLKAKATGRPLLPILAHGGVHSILMLFVLLFFVSPITAFLLAALQLAAHTAIDTLKGRLNVWHKPAANPANKIHWIVFGADQFLHILTIELMVYLAAVL